MIFGGKHSDCVECRASSEIAGLALEATSQQEFRSEVLRRMIVWANGDGGLIHKHYPSAAPLETGTYVEMDMDYAKRCVSNWDAHYGREMLPVVQASLALGGVSIDNHGVRQRSHLAFYADIMAPTGLREAVCSNVELGGEMLNVFIVGRSIRERISERSVATLRALLPVFTLGDRLLGKRDQPVEQEPPIVGLSPREREVTDLLTLGYTNREIAMALGSSVHTVRNQVASVFRKAGASTRAELVGILKQRTPDPQ
jgi:DNA-binding CsgD family transcriptional regulator